MKATFFRLSGLQCQKLFCQAIESSNSCSAIFVTPWWNQTMRTQAQSSFVISDTFHKSIATPNSLYHASHRASQNARHWHWDSAVSSTYRSLYWYECSFLCCSAWHLTCSWISRSAEFWPATENLPNKCSRWKRRQILESRSAAEKIRLSRPEMYKLAQLHLSSSAALDNVECIFSTVGLD